jgi:putative oxidoreductase
MEGQMANTLSYLAPVGRVLIAFVFVTAGLAKFGDLAGTMAYTASAGLPGFLGIAAGLLEVGAGLAILVGWQARWAALALAAFSLVTGLLYHYLPAQGLEGMERMLQLTMWNKNLVIVGGLLLLAANGAGRVSLDARRGDAVPVPA